MRPVEPKILRRNRDYCKGELLVRRHRRRIAFVLADEDAGGVADCRSGWMRMRVNSAQGREESEPPRIVEGGSSCESSNSNSGRRQQQLERFSRAVISPAALVHG